MILEEPTLTDEMRHVPPRDWIVNKLDYDLREKIEVCWSCAHDTGSIDPDTLARIDERFAALARWLQRIVALSQNKGGSASKENDLHTRLTHSVYEAVSALSGLDQNSFRRRTPYHQFQLNRAEMIWQALLAALAVQHEIAEDLSAVDSDLAMKLLAPHSPPEPQPVIFRSSPEG